MKSLRNQLICVLCILLTLGCIAQGLISFRLYRDSTSALLDQRLQDDALRLRNGLSDAITNGKNLHACTGREICVAIWDEGLAFPLRTTSPSLPWSRAQEPGFSEMTGPDGSNWRLFTLRDPGRTIQVAQPVSAQNRLAEQAALRTVWPTIIAIPLICLVVFLIVGYTFRRINILGAQVRHFDFGSLQPLCPKGVPAELTPFIDSINRMIVRMTQSMENERRLIADAAHELRTPLTALVLQAGNLQPDIYPANRERFQALCDGIDRTRHLLNQILALSRADTASDLERPERLELKAVAVEVVTELIPIALRNGIDLGAEEMEAGYVFVTRHDLFVALRNILGNAVKYTPRNGTVDVRVARVGSFMVFQVIDTGPGIQEQMLPLVFNRFYRVSQETEGSGLGLSIVKTIAKKYNGHATLKNRNDRSGIIASIQLPAVL